MQYTRIFVLLLLALLVISVIAKGPKTPKRRGKAGKSRAPKVPKVKAIKQKINVRTVAAKINVLEDKVANLSAKVNSMTEGHGLFSDDLPCPIQSTDGFNFSAITSSCYWIDTTLFLNWTNAQNHCQSLHPKAHLVAIETEAEQNLLKAKWYNECGISSVARFWTDGSKIAHDDWFWISGETRVSLGYQNWIPITDLEDERYNCIAVYANEAYGWGNVACWAPHMVVCEIEV